MANGESSSSRRAAQSDKEAAFSAVKARSELFQVRLAELIQAKDTGYVRLEVKVERGRVTHAGVNLFQGAAPSESS